jgi:exopolysaccharide biosynthesis polyprenyl glycosylphosphotransferase
MLGRDRIIRMQIHQLVDACLVALSFWMAFELRNSAAVAQLLGRPHVDTDFEPYVWVYLFLIPAGPLILEAQGLYSRPVRPSRRATLWILLKSCIIMTLGLTLALFFTKLGTTARLIVIWFGGVAFSLLALKEEILRVITRSKLARAQYRRRFLLVGSSEETAQLKADLKKHSQEEIELMVERDFKDMTVAQLADLLHEHSINGVIVGARSANFNQVESVIHACELEGVEVLLVAEFFRPQISRTSFDDFYGRPVMVFRTTPESSWQMVLKQVLDFVLALVMFVLLMPVFVLIGLLIKLTSPGPILFKQQRSGLNGRPFTLYKFRTMVTNAEQLKHELQAMNEMNGPVFKVTNDPRITPTGRLLRKFSLDEFPQLYNVLRGEMSLVGPRPLPVDEVKRFNDLAHRRRLSVKPGLTCLWQIRGRNNVADFRDWVRLDLEYIDNWSFWLDLKILWCTVPIVITGAGAK